MAIVSRGYTGTVDYEDWAVLTSHLGAQYSVFDVDSFGLSAGPGDREVVLSNGRAAGQGIYDVSDSPVTLAGASVLSGSRWDMVALRRDWSGSGETIPVLVTGAPAKALPGRETEPGTLDDHPLYLLRFTAGQTAVQEVVDLRVWHGDGGLFARDPLVRDFLTRIGTVVRIGDVVWSRVLSSEGSPVWRRFDVTQDTGWLGLTPNGGWNFARGVVRRIGSNVFGSIIATRTAGWAAGNGLAILPAGFPAPGPFSWFLISSHSNGEGAEAEIRTDGQIVMSKPSNGDTSVSFHFSYPVPPTS